MLDLEATVIVMALSRDGSLARASRALGIPRTTLARRVEILEASLGVRLVERTQRHLRLTEAGRQLVEHGAPIVDAARQVEAMLQASSKFRLRLAVPPGIGMDVLDEILQKDEATTTELAFDVTFTDREVHPIRDDFDVVVSFSPPTDGTLYARSALRFQWQCVASPAYLAAKGAPKHASDLASHTCIGYRAQGSFSPFLWPLRAGGGVRVSPWFVTNSMDVALQFVSAGRGIGLLPDIRVPSSTQLVPLLADEVGAEGEVYLSMGQRLNDSKRGRRLRSLIEKARMHLMNGR